MTVRPTDGQVTALTWRYCESPELVALLTTIGVRMQSVLDDSESSPEVLAGIKARAWDQVAARYAVLVAQVNVP